LEPVSVLASLFPSPFFDGDHDHGLYQGEVELGEVPPSSVSFAFSFSSGAVSFFEALRSLILVTHFGFWNQLFPSPSGLFLEKDFERGLDHHLLD
jgi:hypothetical protein